MSKTYKDQLAEILFERIETKPKTDCINSGTILAINDNGIYVDLNKAYEGFISAQELGDMAPDQLKVGQQIEFYVLAEDKQLEGVYRLSLRQIENEKKWKDLETLNGQNLEVVVHKILKSGVEVKILSNSMIGFIPYGYIDGKSERLKDIKREDWAGIKIIARLFELDKSKNKVIFNQRVISDEIREAKAVEILNNISIGQIISGEIVRLADFGVFVDIGGLDALIPSSELSWRRFRKPSDILKVGDKIEAKVFKVEIEQRRVALSAKQANSDPWTVLPENIKAGHKQQAKVVSQAEFGVFVEIVPGVEALLHKSNFAADAVPEIGAELNVEIVGVEASKKRMGVKTYAIAEEAKPEKQPEENAATENDFSELKTEEQQEASTHGPVLMDQIGHLSPKELEHV